MSCNINSPDYYDDRVPEYGSLVEMLYQDQYWGRPGGYESIEGLTTDHIDNIIAWLRRNAKSLKLQHDLEFIGLPEPHGEQAQIDTSHGFLALLSQSAEDWLHETILMQRLLEIQQERLGNGQDIRKKESDSDGPNGNGIQSR